MEKATYVDLERTFCYYDLDVIEIAIVKEAEYLQKEIRELEKRRASVMKTLKRVREKVDEFQKEK